MNGAYGGLIVIIFYAGGNGISQEDYLITQNNLDIFTQTSDRILVQE